MDFMKKGFIIGITMCIILIMAFILGLYLYQNNTANIKQTETKKMAEEENEIETNTIQLITTSVNEIKISPNAVIIFERYYKKCGHNSIEQIEVPQDLVNLTQSDIEMKYKDYQIKKFSSNEITLSKQEEGICNEHYILRENYGYVAIYNIDENGKEILNEVTGVVTKYLPETDIARLRDGIKVNGKQELNATIEDYE